MNTKTISIKGRMGITAKKYLIEQKKTLLIFVAGFLGITAVLGLWGGFLGTRPGESSFILYVMFAGLVCAVVASKTFFDMTTKEGRTSLLMTPSTPADKFLTRLLVTIPGMTILAFAGYYVMTYANVLYNLIALDAWVTPSNPLALFEMNSFLGLYIVISSFLFNEAMFVFGSIAWPRKSFLKTIGIFIGLQFLLSTSCMIYIKNDMSFISLNSDAFACIATSIVLAAALGLFYGAYHKLKRSTVI